MFVGYNNEEFNTHAEAQESVYLGVISNYSHQIGVLVKDKEQLYERLRMAHSEKATAVAAFESAQRTTNEYAETIRIAEDRLLQAEERATELLALVDQRGDRIQYLEMESKSNHDEWDRAVGRILELERQLEEQAMKASESDRLAYVANQQLEAANKAVNSQIKMMTDATVRNNYRIAELVEAICDLEGGDKSDFKAVMDAAISQTDTSVGVLEFNDGGHLCCNRFQCVENAEYIIHDAADRIWVVCEEHRQ